MAMSLVCGRRQLLRLLRPQRSFHSVAGSQKPLATELLVAARLGTVLARCLVFPLIVKGQREAAKIHNHMPVIQKFSTKIREAKLTGDYAEFHRATLEMTRYQKKHDLKLSRPLILPLTQAPIFISFFIALREMASLPVPSLQTGGLWWFQDLTVSDPIYALPLVVTATMWAVLELGAETGVQSADLQFMRTVFRVMPLVLLPVTIHFPSAVCMYWLSSNMFSLCQVACLRIPAVRTALKIPQRVKHDTDTLPPREGFLESFKKGWKRAEIAHQLQEREHRMRNQLDLAARGPLRQTFTHNPLLQHDPSHPPNTPKSSKPKSKPWHDTLG